MAAFWRLALAGFLGAFWLLGCQPAAPPRSQPAAAGAAPAAALPASAPAAQAAESPPPPMRKLVIAIVAAQAFGISPNELMAIPWIGKDSGIFARHGFEVDVMVIGGSPRVTQSLVAGDFDYAIAGASSLVRARIQGADPVMLATSTNAAGSFRLLALPTSGIQSVADLRGQMVGVTQYGSDADVALRIMLERAGLAAQDVTIIQHGGSPQGAAALISGNLQAAVVGGAAIQTAVRAGMVVVADARHYKILGPTGALATTRRYVAARACGIERERESVQRFLPAYVEAIHFFKTQRAETIRIMAKYMAGLPEDEVGFLYDEAVDEYLPLPLPTDEAVRAIVERETEPGAPLLAPDEFVDRGFLTEIERSGLVSTLYR